mgnify:CR=1 FL=1
MNEGNKLYINHLFRRVDAERHGDGYGVFAPFECGFAEAPGGLGGIYIKIITSSFRFQSVLPL